MQALVRIISILEAVVSSEGSPNLTTIVNKVGLPLPTVSRLLRSLVEDGLLHINAQGGYQPAARLIALSNIVLTRDNTFEQVERLCEQLRDSSGETVALHRRMSDERTAFLAVESKQSLRRVISVGHTTPLHYGVAGAALMADCPASEIDSYFAGLSSTADERRAFTKLLEQVRQDGWCHVSSYWTPDVTGIGVPIRTGGDVVASLSVSGPSSRMKPAVVHDIAPQALSTAEQIGVLLSITGTTPRGTGQKPRR